MSNAILNGGRLGKIIKNSDKVVRPGNLWTVHVHSFLNYLLNNGFTNIPTPYGIDKNGNEVVSYVEGVVYNDGLPKRFLSDEVLVSVARLLRKYHDIGAGYIEKLTGDEIWMLEKQLPMEVMCHGDFAPYNATFVDGMVSGIIDFDTLHPGPRLWDIAYAVYRWISFVSPENPEYSDDLEEQIRKIKVFVDAYGLDENSRKELPAMMIKRIKSLISYMKEQAGLGNEDFARNIADGHMTLYQQDAEYISENKEKIASGII